MSDNGQSAAARLRLIVVWGFVGISLLWGVVETGANALKLFQ